MALQVIEMDERTEATYRQMFDLTEDQQLPMRLINVWRRAKRMHARCAGGIMSFELEVMVALMSGEQIRNPEGRNVGEITGTADNGYLKWVWWLDVDIDTPIIVHVLGDQEALYKGLGSEAGRTLQVKLLKEPYVKQNKEYHYSKVRLNRAALKEGSTSFQKRRGRPPGAKNKPKAEEVTADG